MKYLIELVANSEGLEPAITGIEELNAKEKELKNTTAQVSAEQKKMMDDYATKAKLGKASIDKLTEGYKNLGKAATGAFGGEAIKGAVKSTESFRSQLRLSRDELTRLLQTGKATTSEIYNMARGAGALKDSVKDAAQVISVLSSDTFKFDAALQGLQVGAAGFQVMAGAAALAGEESEELQKTLVKLNAIMAITSGIQQIVNLTQKESAFRLGTSVAMQKLYNVAIGSSTGVLKGFRIALAATGIGLIVLAIGALVTNWKEFTSIIGISSDKLEKFGEKLRVIKDGIVGFFKGVGDVIKNVLKGDFSEAYESAKNIGNNIADNIKQGIRDRKIEKELNDIIEKSSYLKRLYEIRGEDRKALLEAVEITNAELIKALDKYNKSKSDTDKKARLEAYLEHVAAEQAIRDYDKEAFLKRKAELEKQAKELQERRSSDNQLAAEAAIEANKIEQERLAKNLKSFEEDAKRKQEIEQRLLEQYKDSLKNRRDLEAENAKILEERRIAESQKRFEARRSEIELEIELEKEKQEAIKSTAIEVAQITADAIFQIVNTNRNNEFNAQIQRLNELKDKELSNKELTDAQKARIEKRYQREIAEIKAKQARADKAAAIAQAIINGALAITKIFTSVTALNPAAYAAIAVTAASTAAQIAIIAAQKIPKFAKGTEFVHGGGTETSDSVPAMLSKGERVIDAKTNKLLKGIPNKLIPDLLMPKITTISDGMDYDKLAKAFSKELANNPALMVNFDKQGFTSFIKSGVTISQIKNNRNGI